MQRSDRDDSVAGATDDQPRASRPARVARVVVILLIVAVVCGTYAYYVVRNIDSLISRDLRSLATLTAQIETTISALEAAIRDYGRDYAGRPERIVPTRAAAEEYRAFEMLRRSEVAGATLVTSERTAREVEGSGPDARLRLHYEGPATPPLAPTAVRVEAEGVIELESILQPYFAREFLGIFDVVLLASSDGTVIHSTATAERSPLPVPHGGSADDETGIADAGIIVRELGALKQRTGFREWGPLNVRELRGASHYTRVRLMDREYYLFVQPLRLGGEQCDGCDRPNETTAAATADKTAQKPPVTELLVCALAPRSAFRSRAFAIPAPVFTIAAGVLLLLACCWPFIRIVKLPALTPLTAPDVVMAVLAALVGGAILALAISDTRIFHRLSDIEDQRLAAYARKVRADFIRDLLRVSYLAESLREVAPARDDRSAWSRFMIGPGGHRAWEKGPVWRYPYFRRALWIDRDGRVAVMDASETAPPPADFSDRRLFHDLREERWLVVEDKVSETAAPSRTHRYVMEVVRMRGSHLTLLAIPPRNATEPYFAVAAPFIHFVDPVVPPGFRFAVIDEQGRVLFHSDRERSLTENFFRETEDDRHLRSAFFARRDQQVNGRYWGDDHQMFVAPIPGSPWAVVAMRDETLLRSVNTEMMAITAVLLTLYALICALGFAVLAVVRPKYRAPWLWPHDDLFPDYLTAIAILLLETLALLASIAVLKPGALLLIGFAAPIRGIASAYVVMNAKRGLQLSRAPKPTLKRDGRDVYWVVGIVVSTLLTFLWCVAISSGSVEAALQQYAPAWLFKTILFTLVIATFFATFAVRSVIERAAVKLDAGFRKIAASAGELWRKVVHRRLIRESPVDAAVRAYQLTGVLLLLVSAVMPTLAFLKVASRIGIESHVKWSQLELAAMLERRLNLLETMSLREPRIAHDCHPVQHTFNSVWSLVPRSPKPRPRTIADAAPAQPPPRVPACPPPAAGPSWVPGFLQSFLPRYSESSVAMRELHHDGTSDAEWHWCRDTSTLTLSKRVSLSPEAERALYGTSEPRSLMVSSTVPSLFGLRALSPPRPDLCASPDVIFAEEKAAGGYETLGAKSAADVLENRRLWVVFRWVLYAIVIVIAVYILFSTVGFLARRVFLNEVRQAPWLTRDAPLQPGAGTNVFICHDNRDVHKLVNFAAFSVFQLADVKNGIRTWEVIESEIDAVAATDVLILDFESGANDSIFSAAKLRLFERLIDSRRHTLIVLSTISATTFLARANEVARERWGRVFGAFMRIDQSVLRRGNMVPEEHDHGTDACGPYHRPHTLRDRVLQRSWDECSPQEKLTLFHISTYGLVNARHSAALESLLSRHYVCRSPALRLCCRPFYEFVLRREQESMLAVEAQPDPSGWDRMRIPLVFLAVVTISLVVTTQQEVINATSAIITGLAAGLPALIKLVSILTGRKATDID